MKQKFLIYGFFGILIALVFVLPAFFEKLNFDFSRNSSASSLRNNTSPESFSSPASPSASPIDYSSPTASARTSEASISPQPSSAPTLVTSESPLPSPSDSPNATNKILGLSCGPSSTGLSTIVIAEASPEVTCSDAHAAMNGFNEHLFATDDFGPVQISGYTCESRYEDARNLEQRSVTCQDGISRFEAMYRYPLGGVPIADTASYLSSTGESVGFNANGAGCLINSDQSLWCVSMPDSGSTSILSLPAGSDAPEIVPDAQIGGSAFPMDKELPEGQVITSYGVACLNDGYELKCDNGVTTVSLRGNNFR